MEFNFGDESPPDPCLLAAQLRFSLLHDALPKGKATANAVTELKTLLVTNHMKSYAELCATTINGFTLSVSEKKKIDSEIATKTKALNTELEDAETNHGDMEVVACHKKIAELHHLSSTCAIALTKYEKVETLKGLSTGQKIDICLNKLRLGLLWKNMEVLSVNLEKCESLLEVGGDWERRNRMRVYRGFVSLLQRKFEDASKDFLSTVATFTCTELCTYEKFIFYTVVVSVLALDRVEFKKQVIDSSQVKAVYGKFDWMPEFVHCLHKAEYKTFFVALCRIFPLVHGDRFLRDHSHWWVREIRIKTYSQFLQPYKSVTLAMMSYEFGVGESFLDKELARFIASGRLQAKLDKVNGVVEAAEQTSNHVQYQEVIKQGDLLINRVQVLSRLLGV